MLFIPYDSYVICNVPRSETHLFQFFHTEETKIYYEQNMYLLLISVKISFLINKV